MRRANNAKSKIRARVEHVFAEQKDRMRLFVTVVEFDHAVALRIVDPVRKNGRALIARAGAAQRIGQPVTVNNVIAEDEA
jgi:hypothetical protein